MKTGQSRIELILDLTNKIGGGLKQARSQIESEIGKTQSKIKEMSYQAKKGLEDTAREIPLLKNGLSSFITPATLAATALGAIATGFFKATGRAAEFNHEFRDLANLNLDKSQKEILGLRKLVMDTAWKKGFSANETSSAYNEVQSTIGLYGDAARPIVEKQGEFAKVMNADMGGYVAGTAKAMANWRFGVDRLDDFNKSAYATMQVGVVSFEELSKVQSVYAGASASVKQDFDTANKLFSLFTIRTKSVDEAATLTKSLFNELTKKTTIDAFRKIGINLYNVNGQIKQADVIMLELNKKFMGMDSDKSIVALKNQFRGSEGLIAMIQAATDRSGELKKTFDEFTNSKMDFGNAVTNAHNDIIHRQERLTNRVDNLVIRMGQALLPAKEWLVGAAETAVNRAEWYFASPEDKNKRIAQGQNDIVYEKYGSILSNAKNLPEEHYQKYISAIQADIKQYDDAYMSKTKAYQNADFLETPILSHFYGYEDKMQRLDDKNNYSRQVDKSRSSAFKSFLLDFMDARNSKSQENALPPAGGGNTNNAGLDGVDGSLNQVVGAAKTPRSITVNIDAINKGGINTASTTLQKMDANEIDQWFSDTIFRIIRNVELSYS